MELKILRFCHVQNGRPLAVNPELAESISRPDTVPLSPFNLPSSNLCQRLKNYTLPSSFDTKVLHKNA